MGCKWGAGCWESHEDPQSVSECILIRKKDGCPYGTKCYDRHPIDAINQTDLGLAAYYTSCGRKDYYNEEGKGKFVLFVAAQKWTKSNLEKALGDGAAPSDLWQEIDPHFPSPKVVVGGNVSDDTECDNMGDGESESKGKFGVLRRSMLYGEESSCVPLDRTEGGCLHLDRMLCALEMYAAMDLNVESHCERFMQFVTVQYKSLLWDFMHIVECHGDWKKMGQYVEQSRLDTLAATKCNVANCLLLFRQKMDLDTIQYLEQGDGANDELMFYRDLMDAMHCLLAHGCDIGMLSPFL